MQAPWAQRVLFGRLPLWPGAVFGPFIESLNCVCPTNKALMVGAGRPPALLHPGHSAVPQGGLLSMKDPFVFISTVLAVLQKIVVNEKPRGSNCFLWDQTGFLRASLDGGAWWADVYGVSQSRTHTHTHTALGSTLSLDFQLIRPTCDFLFFFKKKVLTYNFFPGRTPSRPKFSNQPGEEKRVWFPFQLKGTLSQDEPPVYIREATKIFRRGLQFLEWRKKWTNSWRYKKGRGWSKVFNPKLCRHYWMFIWPLVLAQGNSTTDIWGWIILCSTGCSGHLCLPMRCQWQCPNPSCDHPKCLRSCQMSTGWGIKEHRNHSQLKSHWIRWIKRMRAERHQMNGP